MTTNIYLHQSNLSYKYLMINKYFLYGDLYMGLIKKIMLHVLNGILNILIYSQCLTAHTNSTNNRTGDQFAYFQLKILVIRKLFITLITG